MGKDAQSTECWQRRQDQNQKDLQEKWPQHQILSRERNLRREVADFNVEIIVCGQNQEPQGLWIET